MVNLEGAVTVEAIKAIMLGNRSYLENMHPCTLLPGKSAKLTAPGWSREVYIQVIGSKGDGRKRRKHVFEIMQLRIVERGHRMRTDGVEGQFPNPFLQPKQSPSE